MEEFQTPAEPVTLPVDGAEDQARVDSSVKDDTSTQTYSPERLASVALDEVPAAPARSVGRYRLDCCVGRGGFGEVWKGYDPELNRTVAVKLARQDRHFPQAVVDGFRDEARRAGSLSHRGIVTIHDVGRDANGLYIVSEFIDGQTLRSRMRAGPVPLDEAVSLVIQVARALHHAHIHDLVHRDVKPANILLRQNGEAVLTDFGLAVSEQEQLREPEGTVGTWPYMSPEQARGESNRVDARTDLYSLGVVLYELLTGRYPHPANSCREYLQQVIQRPPRPLRTIDDALPEELERICLRCLAKSVDDRFSTCRDLADALARWQASHRPAPLGTREAAAVVADPRGRLRLAIAGACLAVAVAASVVVGLRARPGDSGAALPPLLPGVVPDTAARLPLLDHEPEMVSWQPGDGREPPRFDARERRFAVRSDRTRWIARCGESDARPLELRAVVRVDNWLGFGGLVWGLRDDPEVFPDKGYRCLAVEYLRSDVTEPAKLAALEITLRAVSFDDVRITHTRCIAEQEIAFPERPETPLELSIEPDRLRVRFGGQAEWEPVDLRGMTNWLPNGRTAVGVTGQGRETAIRDLSLRYLPITQELSP